MAMLYFLVGVGVLGYLAHLIVSMIRSWVEVVDDTIAEGERKHETSSAIALDVAKQAAVGAAKVGVAVAVGDVLEGADGAGSVGAGGMSGGAGAGGSF